MHPGRQRAASRGLAALRGCERGSASAPLIFDDSGHLFRGTGARFGHAFLSVAAEPSVGADIGVAAHSFRGELYSFLERFLTADCIQIESVDADLDGFGYGVAGQSGGGNAGSAHRCSGDRKGDVLHSNSP